MNYDTLVVVDGVWKKFSGSLRRAMLLNAADFARELLAVPYSREKLRKGEFWALQDISFELNRGECLGVIGANGSGKSTLLKLVNGIIHPDRGAITVRGKMGALIEVGAGFHPDLDGLENIYVNAAILGLSKKETDARLDSIIDFADIGKAIHSPVKFYSSGMFVRLGFAVAVHTDPDVLLIDEILAVGDVGFRAKCYNMITKLMKSCAVVLVSHNMHMIARYSSRIAWLNRGVASLPDRKGQAMDDYLSQFKSSEPTAQFEDEHSAVESLRLLDDSGQEADLFFTGATMMVELKASIPKGEIPTVFLGILNQEYNFVATVRSDPEVIVNRNGRVHFRIMIRSLSLTPGRYRLSMAMYDRKQWRHFFALDGVKGFVVSGPTTEFGPTTVVMPAEFENM
jgi:lipopolysaccharide transport system ATP-binding protein